ncbi:MAG: hypothetical protein EU547_00025 [Promethearchaeota archaeon]|nr:MAG: hypothetical protein EU547_00025 [Candidatus Lokiarchaeota archaeon]
MIEKENLIKSLDFFDDIELGNDEIALIYERFENILNDPKVERLLLEKASVLKNQNEKEDVKVIMKKLITKLDIDDLNILLNKIIKDEPLSDFLQDFFLEKLI